MLSTVDLERLIAVKRLEIEKEKTALGLSPPRADTIEDKENEAPREKKQVRVTENAVLSEHNDTTEDEKERDDNITSYKLEDNIPAGLERYIRRYVGLPVMLKAGEYSPNNPLIRAERNSGDALLGLGEYERRRNTLRKLRQQQYREYLDQQAKKKQEAKEQAEKERREREDRERQQEEEAERARALERERESSEQRRASVCFVPVATRNVGTSKVDTGVQVGVSRPLSVAVQTDDAEIYRLSPSPTKSQLTQAERELSPRTVVDPHDERPVQPAPWAAGGSWGHGGDTPGQAGDAPGDRAERRRSYGDFDERSVVSRRSPGARLAGDLRHSYMPSIFDADAIHRRNVQAEKEAAERRQFYQQELKDQIEEQQRIREERKSREKMLEQAEMRRLEEQLRMLRVAQEREVGRQRHVATAMKENSTDYEKKRTNLQKEIDIEQQKLLRVSQTNRAITKRNTATSRSDTTHTKLYPIQREISTQEKPPYSTNIPDNSIFSPNYDVDSYLRRNLNPNKDILMLNRFDSNRKSKGCENVVVEKALIHERPKDKREKPKYEPSFLNKDLNDVIDEIPVLRHTPPTQSYKDSNISEGMRLVEDKWQVPAVQKNILKSLPNDEGKNVSILTQLGSIRRQLQLEQLRLDNLSHNG